MITFYDIPGHIGYKISKCGIVLGKTGKQLSVSYTKAGNSTKHSAPQYPVVGMYVNGRCIAGYIHRLLALTFIPNDDTAKTHIDHKNGIKTDYRLENLEWVTPSENLLRRYRNTR